MKNLQGQQGMVLFFALIVLLMMTVIGVALAVNSGQSLRMAGAGSERVQALAAAQGAQSKVVNAQQGSKLANITATHTIADNQFNVTNTLTPLAGDDVNCQRSADASSANLISCRRVEISSEAVFGREDMGRLTVVTGVEQQVLTGS
ncbi:pilus assembly protein PilX [Shewanella sp. NFH-SH190041]|nr:pilus assembly protein PilX [Shewanella sp. NFH-SH190041]